MMNSLAFGGYAQHPICYRSQIPKQVRNDTFSTFAESPTFIIILPVLPPAKLGAFAYTKIQLEKKQTAKASAFCHAELVSLRRLRTASDLLSESDSETSSE